MSGIILFLISFFSLNLLSWLLYLGCSKGISKRAVHQQTFRFLTTSLLASLAPALAYEVMSFRLLMIPSVVAVMWMVTYPLLYHLTNRRSSNDYSHFMDITFGVYLFGLLVSLHSLAASLPWIITPLLTLIELVFFSICLFQIVYYLLYGVCVDTNGMKTIQETHVNEVIEFAHSLGIVKVIAVLLCFVLGIVALFVYQYKSVTDTIPLSLLFFCLEIVCLIVYSYYLFGAKKCVWNRTGLVVLWKTIKEYKQKNYVYREKAEKRLQELVVTQCGSVNVSMPQTILMVIGESANRDYMSAYRTQPRETTPWLSSMKKDTDHFILMANAYSCANQTVPTLERALTEKNQYNDKTFYDSCSIIDIAKKLGYATHWYSNQGHLGSTDTPITLVAESCDVAKWTKQDLGKVQYDETLIDFLKELDPTKNNFLVLHLKGSHFNFTNRYPASYSEAANTPKDDTVEQYRTTLHYTDHVLQMAFEYCKTHLNLSSMLYFSDHGDLPLGRRSPNFKGFGPVRIPMFVYCSDRYRMEHAARYEVLQQNRENHFTNDLIYDLVCGLLDIQSVHFDPTNSFAYKEFRFSRDMLLTNEGRKHINEDDESLYVTL